MILVLACVLVLASQLPVVEARRVYYKTTLRNAAALGYPILLLLKGNQKLSSSLRNLPFCLQRSVAFLRALAELVQLLSSLSWSLWSGVSRDSHRSAWSCRGRGLGSWP